MPTSFEDFQKVNRLRNKELFQRLNPEEGDWDVSDWLVAVMGELGELANLLKKRRRGETIPDWKIWDEYADTFTYLDLLADKLDIPVMSAVMNKFHRVSERYGWQHY